MDKLIESLAAVLIFASILTINILLFQKMTKANENIKLSKPDILSVYLSYVSSVPGNFYTEIPMYIIYLDKGGVNKVATELKIDLRRNRILYGPCIYHDLWKEAFSDITDAIFSLASGGVGRVGTLIKEARVAKIIVGSSDLGMGFAQGYLEEGLLGPKTNLELAMQDAKEFLYADEYSALMDQISTKQAIQSIVAFISDIMIAAGAATSETGIGLVVMAVGFAIRSSLTAVQALIRHFNDEKKCFNDAQWEFVKAYQGYFYKNPAITYRALQIWNSYSIDRAPINNYLLVNGQVPPVVGTPRDADGAVATSIIVKKLEDERKVLIGVNLTLIK